MSYAPQPPTCYHSDALPSRRYNYLSAIFLFLVLLLVLASQELPESTSIFGLFGTLDEKDLSPSQIFRASVAIGVLFGTILVGLWFQTMVNIRHAFDGWPKGALRQMAWPQLFCWAALGFCLSYFDLTLFGAATGVLLLLLLQKARSRHQGLGSWNSLSQSLWGLRWSWFIAMCCQTPNDSSPLTSEQKVIIFACLMLGLITQALPRLSFAYCFFQAKPSAQVSFERHLWITRIERSIVCLALGAYWLIAGPMSEALLFNLAIFCLGRWFYFLVLAELLKLPGWESAVFSEIGPFIDGKDKILPDKRSLDDHHGPRSTRLVPIDRVGDGDLMVSLEVQPRRVSVRTDILSLEVAVAAFLLLLCIGFNTSTHTWYAPESPIDHYAVRVVEMGMGSALVIPDHFEGLHKICATGHWRQLHVHTSLDDHLGVIFLAGFFLALWSRWGGIVVAAWGGSGRRPSRSIRCVSLAWIGTIAVGSLWGWFWFPSTLAFGLVGLAYWMTSTGRFSNWCWKVGLAVQGLKMLSREPAEVEPAKPVEDKGIALEEKVVLHPFTVEIGRAFWSDLKDGSSLPLSAAAAAIIERALGVPCPLVAVETTSLLADAEWQIKVAGICVLSNDENYGARNQPTEFLGERFIPGAGRFLWRLVNRDLTRRLLKEAYLKNPRLVEEVSQQFSLSDLTAVLRGLLQRTLPLGETESWMIPLLNSETEDLNDLVEEIADVMISAGIQPLPWARSDTFEGMLGRVSLQL